MGCGRLREVSLCRLGCRSLLTIHDRPFTTLCRALLDVEIGGMRKELKDAWEYTELSILIVCLVVTLIKMDWPLLNHKTYHFSPRTTVTLGPHVLAGFETYEVDAA